MLLIAQENVSLDLEAGASKIVSKQVRGAYGAGLKFLAGPKFNLSQNQRYHLLIHGGFQWHLKETDQPNDITDHLRIIKAGTQFHYKVLARKKPLSAYASLDYNIVAHYFSAVAEYNPITLRRQTITSEKFLKGNAVSFGLGTEWLLDPVYFKLQFDYLKPNMKVDPVVLAAAQEIGVTVPNRYDYNFSSISLTIGYELNL